MYPKYYPDKSTAGIAGSSPHHYQFYSEPAASILYLLSPQIINNLFRLVSLLSTQTDRLIRVGPNIYLSTFTIQKPL